MKEWKRTWFGWLAVTSSAKDRKFSEFSCVREYASIGDLLRERPVAKSCARPFPHFELSAARLFTELSFRKQSKYAQNANQKTDRVPDFTFALVSCWNRILLKKCPVNFTMWAIVTPESKNGKPIRLSSWRRLNWWKSISWVPCRSWTILTITKGSSN